jgi:hypothetical protein
MVSLIRNGRPVRSVAAMTSSELASADVLDKLAQLEREVAGLRTELAHSAQSPRPKRRGFRIALIVAGAVLAYAAVGGVAEAAGKTTGPSSYRAVPAATLVTKTLSSSGTETFHVTGVAGIPSAATAATLNITASGQSATGDLYVYAAGASKPAEPNLDWSAGHSVAESVTVAIGTSGEVTLKNGSGTVKLVVQVDGYYAPATALGTAGGVLTGTYPDPGLAPSAVRTTNISTSGGATGKVLTDTGSGVSWQAPPVVFTNTVVVAGNSTATANGTALLKAIAALSGTDNLVLLEPGSYDVGATSVMLPADTWLEGAGQSITTVTGEDVYATVTLDGADDGVSNLSITDASSNNQNYAIGLAIHNSATVDGVTIDASIASTTVYSADAIEAEDSGSAGITIENSTIDDEVTSNTYADGIVQYGTAPLLVRNDEITSTTAAQNFSIGLSSSASTGQMTVRDSDISAVGPSGVIADGIDNGSGTTIVIGSRISGATNSVVAAGVSRGDVADSELIGPPSGPVTCVGAYSASFAALNTSCT